MTKPRIIATALIALTLAVSLSACDTTDCDTPRTNGNPAQQYHAACGN